MTVEPMTDAGLTKLSKRLLEYADRDVFGLYARDMRCVLARLASAEATISTLTAERDAALARAMPDGWVVVPKEPTLEMNVAGVEAMGAAERAAQRRADAVLAPRNAFQRGMDSGGIQACNSINLVAAYRAMIDATPDLPIPTPGDTP